MARKSIRGARTRLVQLKLDPMLDPMLAPLRSGPGYASLLARLHLAP
ncbi:MAG TPA: hypothetical protein VGX92_08505 [Pyrinomonadaceae bacterium]|nr:hypothetical protein [Pyrinomonadaceae bacterium]